MWLYIRIMSGYIRYKLIVRDDEPCMRLLRYLTKNIVTINKLGAKVRINKIDTELDAEAVEKLRAEGIVRLPALIDPDGNPIIGLKKIVDLFEKNINKNKDTGAGSTTSIYGGPAKNSEFGANPELNDFYMQELFSGRDQQGKLVARKDKDEAEDEGVSGDMQRRMAEYRPPAHRTGERANTRTDFDRDDRYEDTRAPPTRQDYPDDNIADVTPPRRNRDRMTTQAQGPPQGEDDMDQRMLDTYMSNNGLDY